jgi:branched-chain amino acid transport system substrate-binding protein
MRPIRSNLFKGGLLASTIALALAGCGSSGSSSGSSAGSSSTTSKPIVIGETSDLAGPTASYFGGMEEGLTTYVDYLNAHGGIKGQKIKLISLNDSGDPASASVNYQQLKADGAVMIIANTYNTASTPLFALSARDQIPILVPTLNGGGPTPYVFGYAPDTPDSMVTQLDFAVQYVLKTSANDVRAAFVSVGDPEITPLVQAALGQALGQGGGKLVDSEALTPTETSFTVQAQKIAAAKANVIITAESAGSDPIMVKALRAAGVTAPIVGYSFDYADSLLKTLADPGVYNYYYAPDPSTPGIPALQVMNQRAAAAHLSTAVGPTFTEFYVFGEVLAAALGHCAPNCTGATLNTALENNTLGTNTDGLSTTVGFSTTDHSMAAKVQFVHITGPGGQIVTVGPPVTVANNAKG